MLDNPWHPYDLASALERHFTVMPNHKPFCSKDYLEIVDMLQQFKGKRTVKELTDMVENLKKLPQEKLIINVRRIIRLQKISSYINFNKK
jgi:hypothetical protein